MWRTVASSRSLEFVASVTETELNVVGDKTALQQLSSLAFDWLVTDKNLPSVDGIELARVARRRSERMGIILMTGFASFDSAQMLLGIADDYIAKPFQLRQLSGAHDSTRERH